MHQLLRVLLFVATLILSDRKTTYALDNSTGSLTCTEDGHADIDLDLTCSNRFGSFSCEIYWVARPCRCDPKCDLYDECCPDTDEMVAAGTLIERNVYPDVPDILPDKMAWEDSYLSYMTCVKVLGISYKPLGSYDESVSYHLISKCPAGVLQGSTTHQYCENPPTSEDIFITPITVESIGHFKNLYCALCHGVSLTDMEPWSWNWHCDVDETGSSGTSGSEIGQGLPQTAEELISLFCSVIYEPPSGIPNEIIPRPCFQVDVTTCSIDDTGTSDRCPTYLAPVQVNGTIYQNPHCAHCNGIDVCEDYNELCKSVEYRVIMTQTGTPPTLSEYFSLFNDTQTLASKSCGENEAFDVLTSTCQLLYCFPGFEYNITTKECERVPVDEKGRICLTFHSGREEMNMTSSDMEYLSVAVKNLILEAALEVLTFFFVVSEPELTCIEAQTLKDDCNETPHYLICQVCFDVELNFTALPPSYMELDLGINRLFNDTFCSYMPSFGNLSMVELLIDVPAGWDCQTHASWTFADYNNPSLQPFQLNLTRDTADYILNVIPIHDICANYTQLVCGQYGNLESSQFEMVTIQSKESLRIIATDTVLSQDQFQINPDGSAVYCVGNNVSSPTTSPADHNSSEGSLTCYEDGQEDGDLDLTCPNRDYPYTCDIKWTNRPCKCDPMCGIYDECCPNYDEMVAAGTLIERFVYPDIPDILPDKMAWEESYLSYLTCVTLWGISFRFNINETVSRSYHMISKCPASVLQGTTAYQYCENPPTSEDIFITPITVESIGHFKNLYCALCHGVTLTDMEPWSWNWHCDAVLISGSSSLNEQRPPPTAEELITSSSSCSVIYEPPSDKPDDITARPCFKVDVTTCFIDDTGTRDRCPTYLAPVQVNGTVYQNQHCAHCNGIDVCEDYNELCESLLYIKSDVQSGGVPPALAEYFSFFNDDQEKAAQLCNENEAFDVLTSTCQVLYCFPGFEYNITTKECERLPVAEKGRICLSFLSGQEEMNMTSSDTEYLSAAVNNLILEASLDVLAFSFVVSEPELSCIPMETMVDDCNKTPHHLICQVCFNVEMNFTALPQSSTELDLGTYRLFNDTSCLYMPSFGNLSMVELLIDVPADWSCQTHSSWTFADYNKPFLQPFQLNLTRDTVDYILSVITIDDICANNTRLVCDKYGSLQSSEFKMVTNQSLQIIDSSTVILQDEFQIKPDGSAVYCLQEYVSAGRNLPEGLNIMNMVGTILSIISVLIIITTYLLFPKLRNLAGKSVLALSTALLITFLLIFAGTVSSRSEILCKAIAAITHFFWLSVFFWMNALAIDLNRTFGTRAKIRIGNKSQIFYVWYSLYAWGTPALIVGACLLIDLCDCTNLSFKYGDDGLCWLSSGDANLYGFGVPLAALLFLNAILFSDTVVGIRLTKKASEKALKERPALEKAKEELSLYIKLSGVMGFTWILAYVCEYANVPELWYIFTALNSLQGVFILLAFGFNRRFIAQWKEKLGIRRDDVTSSSANTKSTSKGNTTSVKKTEDQAANQM